MFEFATATKIIHGPGTAASLGKHAARFGKRGMLVTGSNPARYAHVLRSLENAGLELTQLSVTGEPSVEAADHGAKLAREAKLEFVISLGGGSVIDLGKSVACLATNPGKALDYLEVIGAGHSISVPSLPFIALPTTSGTGAEVTRNAVLGSKQHAVKASLRSEWMLPTLALVDAELALTLPRSATAATGLDALTQVLEPYLSCAANPLTDALCAEALSRVGNALLQVCRDGSDLNARNEMSIVSLFGGLALANAKLGAVHGLAGPLGGMLNAAHGALCARLLSPTLSVNLRAVLSKGDTGLSARFTRAAQLVLGNSSATAYDLVRWFDEVCTEMQIPRLSAYGFERRQIDETVGKAQRASSMKGNPIPLSDDEVGAILEAAL